MWTAPPKPLLLATAATAAALSGACVLFRPYVSDLKFAHLERTTEQNFSDTATTMRLTFTTRRNLSDLGYGAHTSVDLCPSVELRRLPVRDLRYHGQRLFEADNAAIDAEAGLHEYETTFVFDPSLLDDLDVTTPTPDLCFEVKAPSYFGMGGFDSRPAVIPGDAIDAALRAPVQR